MTRRRAVLEALGVRVIIKPARKGAGFDPESVVFAYEGEQACAAGVAVVPVSTAEVGP